MRPPSAAPRAPDRPVPARPVLPVLEPQLPREQRIEDLIGRLTLVEKISQLVHDNNPVERLGVPAYNWWNEACHGVARNGRATVFPQVIGLAATWNRALVHRIAAAIADEARAKHHAAAAAARRGQYQGLTFWTPNVNILRDPRWGRGQETFGEDPYLTGELAEAMVRGLQGDDPKYLKVAACAKHFAVHSGPEAERHAFDACPSAKDMTETYLPAFQKLVAAGVEAVMAAYNRVLGEPACASRFLLGAVLRGRWGFRGHVVSDCGAVDDFHVHHKVTRNAAESAALAVRAGCDLNCGCTFNDLGLAVEAGLITEAEIDRALRRLLGTKFRLGLFDPPDQVPHAAIPVSVIESPAHRALARRAAAEAVVVLKNARQVLPLRSDPVSMLVVGPTAANVNAMLGNYAGISSRLVTIVEGLAERVDGSTIFEYRAGCPLQEPVSPGVNHTFGTAAAAEIVIAVLGLDPTLEGEEGEAVASAGGDRRTIELPAVQREFLRELRRHARTLVLVLTGGSALAIPEEHELCDAVLCAWYPGCEGGRGVADVLFGDVPPAGKLPVTVPRRTADLPAFEDYAMRGRTYRFAQVEPLYPFGFGLTYAQLEYGALALDAETLAESGQLIVGTAIANRSGRAADEVVQCYVVPPASWPDAPRATLVGFSRISIAPGASALVEFRLPAEAFRQVGASGEWVWVPGDYGIVVGGASPGRTAQALGAPAPANGRVELV